jgi:epoxyqueuosine reductase
VWVERLRGWAAELGFSQIGVVSLDEAKADIAQHAQGLTAWLDAGHHGSMDYMRRHAHLRADPTRLMASAASAIVVRMDYRPSDDGEDWRDREWQRLHAPTQATVSVYARGRDYHKVMRQRLQRLADRLQAQLGPMGHRAFVDSGPVMEVALAQRSGVGWRGKHTLALSREAGSMFFLGTLLVDLALPPTAAVSAHCGTCTACMDVCPTQAIVAPYRLDARRCIAYLTIEHEGPIPEHLRTSIGNRVFGCDDCQLACPWNKHAQRATIADFDARAPLNGPVSLLDLWAWDEATFTARAQGTVLHRTGYTRWRRNLAVGLGNALRAAGISTQDATQLAKALHAARPTACDMVAEHIDWALATTIRTQPPVGQAAG